MGTGPRTRLQLNTSMYTGNASPEISPSTTLAFVHTTRGEACVLDHLCKVWLAWELSY